MRVGQTSGHPGLGKTGVALVRKRNSGKPCNHVRA